MEIPFSAYSGDDTYIFVSYSHIDNAVVYPIIKELHERGVLIWYDEGIDVGAEWPKRIADRILMCEKVLLFISPNSINSNHVKQEIVFANGKGKKILPVYIEPTRLDPGVEMTLSVYQAIFYYALKPNAFYSQLIAAIRNEPTIEASTELASFGGAAFRLDDYGDKSNPPIIHLRGEHTIGRFDASLGVKQNDFEFSADKKNISRKHAIFHHNANGYFITDLGSMAGTWVNGIRIPPNTQTEILGGDRVAFGTMGASHIFEILLEV